MPFKYNIACEFFFMVSSDFRDTSTLTPIIPDCRTTILVPSQDYGAIRKVVSAERFICVCCETGISLFASDVPSSAIVDTPALGQSKKGSTPLRQTSCYKPVVSLACDDIENISLSSCGRFLFVFNSDGVSCINFTNEAPALTTLYKARISFGISVQNLVDRGLLMWTEGSNQRKLFSAQFSVGDDGIKLGPKTAFDVGASSGKGGDIAFGFADGLLGLVIGDRVSLYTLRSDSVSFEDPVSGAGISSQNGEITSVIPLAGDRVIPNVSTVSGGLLIVQRDVMTVFSQTDSNKLELVFQFRDSISKHEYISASVDSVKPWMVCVSTESFNNRVHLELFDLSLLKQKSVSLAPLMRFDVSRLFNRKEGDMIVSFINTKMPAFVQSVLDDATGHRVCIVWESVFKDQWYSFMPNFKVLNKNLPYIESEEEFDFNQNADMGTVCSSLNRYRKASKKIFDFIPGASAQTKLENELMDTNMTEESNSRSDEYFIPFLAPLDSWKSRTSNVIEAEGEAEGKRIEFFGPSCARILSEVVGRSR